MNSRIWRHGRSLGLGAAMILAGLVRPCCASAGDRFWAGAERIEVATGEGRKGRWRQNDSDFAYVDDPAVAVTRDGHVGVVWVDQARKDVFFQSYAPDGAARSPRPVIVSSRPATFSWLPRIVIGAGDAPHIYALWQEIIFSGGSHGGEILFARSTDGGATFGAPINLSDSRAGDGKGRLTAKRWDNGSLDLALGPDGSLHAAWTTYEGGLWVARSTDRGRSFSAPARVAGDDGRPARAPSLALDGAGRVHLAWTIGEDADADIRVATSGDGGGTFGEPVVVPDPGHSDAPKLAMDGEGTLHLVWSESSGGPFQRYRIRYARRAGDGFSPPRTIAGPREGVASVNFPDLAIDAGGRLFVVWKRFPRLGRRAQGIGFTISQDGGRTFAAPGLVPDSGAAGPGANGSLQGGLMAPLAVNDTGALALGVSTFARGDASRVWLLRRPPDGAERGARDGPG